MMYVCVYVYFCQRISILNCNTKSKFGINQMMLEIFFKDDLCGWPCKKNSKPLWSLDEILLSKYYEISIHYLDKQKNIYCDP